MQKAKKATLLELDTSRKLEGAMKLYENFGFKISNEEGNEAYARCTVKMVMDLNQLLLLLITISAIVYYYMGLMNHVPEVARVFPRFSMVDLFRQVSMMIDIIIQ